MEKGIIFMMHGNLQYSQLPIEKRGEVARQSYAKIFEICEKMKAKIAFEASGETLEIVAEEAPEVLEKLKELIERGLIEPVASPQTHIMLGNIDREIGLMSLVEGLDTWERLTGVRPVTGWNPECSWASYIPDIFREAGFENLIADADSYFLSTLDGIREKTGLTFDVRGHSNKNELFRLEDSVASSEEAMTALTMPNRLPNGLNIILRSDMMCGSIMLWYLIGATEGNRKEPVSLDEIRENLVKWRQRIPENGGFIMPYAEDAEYVGTFAYFYVKQCGEARFFDPNPDSVRRLEEILTSAKELEFTFVTPSMAVEKYGTVEGKGFERIERGCAWHGGTSLAWVNTIYSRILDPACRMMFDGIKTIAADRGVEIIKDENLREILKKITTAYVSDARWPPAPTSPGRFNVREALDSLKEANNKIREYMKQTNIADKLGLYSPNIMESQLAAIDDELMNMEYFGEAK